MTPYNHPIPIANNSTHNHEMLYVTHTVTSVGLTAGVNRNLYWLDLQETLRLFDNNLSGSLISQNEKLKAGDFFSFGSLISQNEKFKAGDFF